MNPPRDDVPERYRFDLSRIYETPADWTDACEDFREEIATLEALADVDIEEANDLRALLETTEDAHRQKQRLGLYATLARDIATDDDAAADRRRRFETLDADFTAAVDAVRYRLAATDRDTLDAAIDALDEYRRYAEDFREQSRYALDPSVAETVAAYEKTTDTPTNIVRAASTEDFDADPIEGPDGDQVEITRGNYISELADPDREYRRRVYETFRAELDRFEATITEAVAGKIRAAGADAEVRGYESVRDRALRRPSYPDSGLRCRLLEEVHDTMLTSVRENLDSYHRALRIRRERLGVDALRPWDRRVSIVDADPPTVDYDEAREHILTALEPLGEDYVETLEAFFEDRRIDVVPTQSKRTDITAYCPSSAADGAYILANFREDVRSTYILCHELGHAMHVEQHRSGPTRYATAPRPMSEVPSLLHELLLTDHFLDVGGPLAAAARNRVVSLLAGNLFRAARRSAFTHEIVTTVESGTELTPTRARKAWADLQSEFEPLVEFDDRAGRNWLYGWTRELYSRYQYVLGAAGALAVRDALRNGPLTTDEYRSVLAETGRRSSVETFQRLDCDPTSEAFYERAAGVFDGYLDRL
ncbi:M3 family oligoendopeptidase [Natronomonas sp.]|uniref:M3 family oligoendopeptidase n=1 Tax=Natronomonas sp. TaxID=2184060 RepID=UPI002FC39E01